MRTQRRDERFRLRGYGSAPGDGVADVRVYPVARQVLRALGALAGIWLAALASAFIPVAHLLLVPGFLVWGMVLFVRRLRTDRVALGVRGTCPDCGEDQAFEAGGRWRLPRTFTCAACRRALRAEALAAAEFPDTPAGDPG